MVEAVAEELAELGFSMLDQQGIPASLRSHRDAARKLDVSQAHRSFQKAIAAPDAHPLS